MTDSRSPVGRSTPPSHTARAVPTHRITTEIAAMPAVSITPILRRAMLRGVCSAVVWLSIVLMRPSSVPLPVVVTTPRPVPQETSEPPKAMLRRSPRLASSATGSVVLSTGTDSPVSAASSICSERN